MPERTQYPADDLLPISALQHLIYCERQAALIHLEGIWIENRYTAEGKVLHERADHAPSESRGAVRIVRGLRLQSLSLGLTGRADVVEFHQVPGCRQRCVPVEYKRGRPKKHNADRIQLCAQALCLEEMTGAEVPEGALFYGQHRRRKAVDFDAELREATRSAARRLHELLNSRTTPAPVNDERCEHCSLRPICLPAIQSRSVQRYLKSVTRRAREEAAPT